MDSESVLPPVDSPVSLPSAGLKSFDWVSLLQDARQYKAAIVLLTPAVTIFLWFFVSYQTSPLKKYPGPFLAGWTNLWRLYHTWAANYGPYIKKLHERYGPVVRIGPNLLDIDYPEISKVIYGTDGSWIKTDFYKNSSSVVDGQIQYHMFSQVESVKHARMKRPVVRHYSTSAVLAMEPNMDTVIREFTKHLDDRFVKPKKVCDFGNWIGYFAWDFLGKNTFSQSFGYMEAGHDFDGSLGIADKSIDYLALCGQMPWLDYWLDKNPVYPLGPPNIGNVTGIAVQSMITRMKGEDKNFNPEKPDFLQYFIESKSSHPEVVDDSAIIGYLLLNLIAGADTTSINLKALFYYCLKDQRIWKKLVTEVREKAPRDEPCPHAIAKQIPYLEAVIKESIRFHPPVSMIMERVVPPQGLALPDGRHVPGGSFVGMNPYITGRNKNIFGDNADEFYPDRWLQEDDETDEAYTERMQRFNSAWLAFGGGSRICLGRNLSQMEVYKIVPTLLARYDIELDDPNEVWWSSARWFYRVDGVICKIKRRSD